jgi:hypothetical protein
MRDQIFAPFGKLVIDFKTANAVGPTVPDRLIYTADESSEVTRCRV